MINRSSVAPADLKGDDRGDPALTKRICGFDSRLLLGPGVERLVFGTCSVGRKQETKCCNLK